MLRSAAVAVVLFVLGAFVPPAAQAKGKVPDSPVAPARDTEPVVLKGSALAGWSVPANQTVKLPFMDLAGSEACQATVGPPDPDKVKPGSYDPTEGGVGIPDPTGPTAGAVTYDPEACPPQDYAKPEIDTADVQLATGHGAGTPVDRILGFRYDKAKGKFVEIPVQVDEVFTRYLDNSRSGFALYSGQDQHTTYAYDREGFRYTDSEPGSCTAIPRMVDGVRLKAMPDPIPGLDNNDEIAFMYSDAGPRAPATAALPGGIEDARAIALADPFGTRKPRFVYLMRGTENGRRPRFDAANGYVHYRRDGNADQFAFSESSYDSYGNAPDGEYCSDPREGKPQHGVGQRRPLDTATVSTDRYRFRYDGRWLLTKIQIAGKDDGDYGPDLVDRWKARAFAQDPESETPCCGYEEEDSNWGGSSITLGEKEGPVRAIRETWGADSGTNVIRRETFYGREMRQKTWLRVHVIPPLDGIYSQWDFNAGRVSTFYNPRNSDAGFPIDGKNDEVFGNLDDPCNDNYDESDTGAFTQGYRQAYRKLAYDKYSFCDPFPYHLSADLPDPTVSDANASLSWSMVTGEDGTIVDRTSASIEDLSPAGAAQSVMAVPYYRDDACFDDGTGSDPGTELYPRQPSRERASKAPDGGKRRCWRGDPAVPNGDTRFWQGSIATHGIHILFIADSDNARLTVPVSEVVAETRMVMVPGVHSGALGEQYGRGFEKALGVAATPFVPIAAPAAPSVPGAPAVGVPGTPDAPGVPAAPSAPDAELPSGGLPSAPSVGAPSTPGAPSVGTPSTPSTPGAPSVGVPGLPSTPGQGNDGGSGSGNGNSAAGQTPAPSGGDKTPAKGQDKAPDKGTSSPSSGGTSQPAKSDPAPAAKPKPKPHAKPKKTRACKGKKGKARKRCLRKHKKRRG